MRKYFSVLVLMLLAYFGPVGCHTGKWQQVDMSSRRNAFIELDLAPGSLGCAFLSQCTFELHYFEGRQQQLSRDKVVLYIPGGPGDIVDREKHALSFAEMATKLIYFDVRGTGYSVIPETNDYDQFLRAKYVVEDIEALRRKTFNECSEKQLWDRFEGPSDELNCKVVDTPTKWDAIYAHSWGTVVAQMYAKTYGNVKRLILSAPVSRAHIDTGAARRARLVKNLIEIFRQGGAGGVACSWPADGVIKKMEPEQLRLLTARFCFLTETDLKQIEQKFMSLLIDVERDYGSTAFVGRFYSLVLQDEDFGGRYRYRVEFYKALRALEWFGGGELPGFRFEKQVREKKIDAALLLGYYLLLEEDELPPLPDNLDKVPPFRCRLNSPFIKLISSDMVRNQFCIRINGVVRGIGLQDVYDDSLRAQTVFGVFDGVARWIFHIQGKDGPLKQDSCFKAEVLQKIAVKKLFSKKKAVRDVVKRIGLMGVDLDSEICPWDASEYKHNVETLILAGESDPITAGNQAMYVLEHGLTPGKRVLIQFPGAGHLMAPQLKIDKTNGKEPSDAEIAFHFGSLLNNFINVTNNVDDFIKSEKVEKHLTRLGATLISMN
jgi:pimeloyl-ACP methyl ester carboxylesterase